MSTLTKLLNFLPTCFNIRPLQVSVFTLVHDDPKAKMVHSIKDNILTCRSFSSFTNDIEINMEGLTIKGVVGKINAHHNYSATIHSMGELSALRLAEVENSRDATVYVFNSPTWAIFKAMGLELKEAQDMMLKSLNQMSIQGSTGYVTDYWCEYFNNRRKTGESDIDFGIRTIYEIGLPKSNNMAMEIILEKYYGFPIEVIDLVFEQTSIMYMNDKTTPVHNPKYPIANCDSIQKEPGTFGLIFPENTISTWDTNQIDELRQIVYRIKAAGTRCKIFWSDYPDDPWMYMNTVATPVHDTRFILPMTKNSEYFSIYL